jgi:hypothetical protein
MTLSSNLAQIEFVIRIAEDYLDLVMGNRSFLAPFIEACLVRLTEVRTQKIVTAYVITVEKLSLQIDANPLKEHLTSTATDLGTFVQV